MNNSGSKDLTVYCPAGYSVLGGGASVDSASIDDKLLSVQESYPISDGSWQVRVVRTGNCDCFNYDWQVTAWAICASR